MQEKNIDLALLFKDIDYIKRDIHEMKTDLKSVSGLYVTRKEFELEIKPLKRIVYGLISIILSSVVLAIISLVLTK